MGTEMTKSLTILLYQNLVEYEILLHQKIFGLILKTQ